MKLGYTRCLSNCGRDLSFKKNLYEEQIVDCKCGAKHRIKPYKNGTKQVDWINMINDEKYNEYNSNGELR